MPDQQFIPGTEPPGRDEEIERAIEAKYKAAAEEKLAKEATKIRLAKLLELVEARGTPYPFLEPGTGRRKVLRLDAQKRLKSVKAPSQKQEQADREWAAAQAEARGGEQQDAAKEGWAAEVKRRRGEQDAATTDDYLPADPFGATREALSGADEETPAERSARESEEARAARRKKAK